MRTNHGYFEEKPLEKKYDFKLLGRLFQFVKPYWFSLSISVLLVVAITVLDLALPYVTKMAVDRYIVPVTDTDSDPAAEGGSQRQVLSVTLDSPEKTAIVRRYGDLFEINGPTARIHFEDLARLSTRELALLRKEDLEGVKRLTLLFLGMVLLNFGLNFAQRLIMEYTGHRIMHNLRMALFQHVQGLSVKFFTRNPVGRLVTRLTNDVQNMHELFTSVITLVFKDIFLLVGITAALLALHWKLTLATFSVAPLVIWAAAVFSAKARDLFRLLRVKIAEINTRFAETIGGIRIIQLFVQERNNYRKFKELNHENFEIGLRQVRVLAVFLPLIEFLGVLSLAVIIFYGGYGVLHGTLSLGALVAFISYVKMFFRPIRDLAEKYNELQNAMASAERIFQLFDSRDRLPAKQSEGGIARRGPGKISAIALEAVSFAYVPGEPVLNQIDLSIHAGETVAIVGPTGSGKTSLVNLIIRFYDPTRGSIRCNGQDIRALDLSAYRKKFALVVQDPFLFSGTIRQNIFPEDGRRPAAPDEIDRILSLSNCNHFVSRLPRGLDTWISEGGISISSGERQLLSIARAFAADPEVILFDEATSYIDSQTEFEIQQAIENLMRDRTALIVAHRLSTVRHADRIIVLHRGRIIESGTHADLIKRRGFYYNLHRLQG